MRGSPPTQCGRSGAVSTCCSGNSTGCENATTGPDRNASGAGRLVGQEKRRMGSTNTRIYGEHDEKTIQQLNRCMQVGSAAKGVLCADGHLGYAHPIGG